MSDGPITPEFLWALSAQWQKHSERVGAICFLVGLTLGLVLGWRFL